MSDIYDNLKSEAEKAIAEGQRIQKQHVNLKKPKDLRSLNEHISKNEKLMKKVVNTKREYKDGKGPSALSEEEKEKRFNILDNLHAKWKDLIAYKK